jgi:hypothetical protein
MRTVRLRARLRPKTSAKISSAASAPKPPKPPPPKPPRPPPKPPPKALRWEPSALISPRSYWARYSLSPRIE